MKISDIDKNLRVEETLGIDNIKWLSAGSPEFRLYGSTIDCGHGPFLRLSPEKSSAVSVNVDCLSRHTPGLRLRLRTDSPYIAIHAEWKEQTLFPHMPVTGVSGFDLYRDGETGQEFAGTFTPPFNCPHGYESVLPTPGGMQDLVVEFPLYNEVSKLFIGVNEGSRFEAPAEYALPLPVVFYGSSITQGGCASRPGCAYQNMLSRGLNIDILNLGFSGSALGEEAMAKIIADIPMALFVCDYDHNAHTPEHLEATHYALYKTVRERQPDIPYVILSKPDGRSTISSPVEVNMRRRDIIRATYERAKAEGDNNVYFIDGFSLFESDETFSATVDGCHPNDLGFYFFYRALKPLLEKLLF